MSNIYQITGEFQNLVRILTENEGELTPELETALAINKDELQAKGVNYGFVIKTIESEIDIIDAEIERLQGLKKVRVNATDRLKKTLTDAMNLYEMTEIKSPIIKISFRASESVEILDESLLEPGYVVEKITHSPDKAKIKDAIKSGINVVGAILQTNQNIQIK
jgi:hypothetical protein